MVSRLLGGSIFVLILLVVAVLLFGSTLAPATHVTHHTTFVWGLLHGFLLVPVFIAKVFHEHKYELWQIHNSGLGYDGGYVLGAAVFFGMGSRVV